MCQKTIVDTMVLATIQQAIPNDVMAVCIGSMRKQKVTDPNIEFGWCAAHDAWSRE